MNNKHIVFFLLLLLPIALLTRCKNKDIGVDTFTIESETIHPEAYSVSVLGTFSFLGEVNGMYMQIGLSEDLNDATKYEMQLEDNIFSITINELQPATTYYYCYDIDFGTSNEHITPTSSFSTHSSVPLVKTIETLMVDSTTYLIKSEAVSNGGMSLLNLGICWNTNDDPQPTDSCVYSQQNSLGEYNCYMTHLLPSTTYFVRAFATNDNGVGLGNILQFTTMEAIEMPSVYTFEAENITMTSATCGGSVLSEGSSTVTERGICWGLESEPDLNDNHCESGSGLGVFSINLTDLEPAKTYYVRAYAINSQSIKYGNEVTFRTISPTPTFNITVSAEPEEGGRATGGGICQQGQSCTVTATPNANYNFINWTEDDDVVSCDTNYTFTVNSNRILVANFTANPVPTHTIAVSANPTEGGTVGGGGNFTEGQSCTVTATPNTNYTFTNWTENGTVVSTNASYTFTVTNNHTLVANFTYVPPTYTINVSANPTNGGNITGGGTFQQGQSCTVVATPSANYNFTNWTENGSVVSTNPSYTFTVNSNRDLVANFTANPVPTYTITVSANPTDGGNVMGGGTFLQGQSCTVVATPTANQIFTNWTENGSVVSTNANYTFIVIDNRSLVANFSGPPTGAINGAFSVSANQQVYFSQGNLRYQASTYTWRFADNQYDYVGNDNNNISSTYSGWIDLFGWGTSGYNGKYPYMTITSSAQYGDGTNPIAGTNYDWGVYNTISNSNSQQWRTLTEQEWNYVFNTRLASTINGINNSRFVKATVDDIKGIILFPDDYCHPNDIAISGINDHEAPFRDNEFKVRDFEQMQALGCVFLPAAGTRNGSNVSQDTVGEQGNYWSSSHYGSGYAYRLHFDDRELKANDYKARYLGQSVRLVHPIP